MPEITVSARTRFTQCLTEVLRHEGGYADHPADPGGATNFGVTRKTLARWRGIAPWWQLPKADVKALAKAEVSRIYRGLYWDRCNGAALPAGVDLVVFDYAVNSGAPRAIGALQMTLGLVVDGYAGPLTIAALALRIELLGAPALIETLCDQRLGFLERLKSFAVFGRGWSARVASVRTTALAMASTPSPIPEDLSA